MILPKRILVVDDNPEILSILGDYFQSVGYQVDYASTGHSAFDYINQTLYELIITDINIPELDGFDIITHIRANDNNSATPIIVITGVSDLTLTNKLNLLGINGFLKKPFTIEEIIHSVQTILAQPSTNEIGKIDNPWTEQIDFLQNQYRKVLDKFDNYIQISTNILRVLDLNELAFSLMTYADVELGLNQSVFWVIDETEKLIRPVRAVGPVNLKEYQSNLEKITSLSIQDLLNEYRKESDIALNQQIQSLIFPLEGDHIFRQIILDQQTQPIIVHHNLKDTEYNRLLINTFQTEEFILIPIVESKGNIQAIIYGNTAFSHAIIPQENISRLTSIITIGQLVFKHALLYERVKKSEEKYRNIVDNALDIIFSMDLNFWIISTNPAVKSILGYMPEEMIGKRILDFICPAFIRKNRSKINFHKVSYQGEVDIIRADGSICILELRTRKTRNERDQELIEGIARDISEKKHLEKQLKQSLKELSHQNLALNQLLKVDASITKNMSINEILMAVCQSILDAKTYGRAVITVFDENWQPRYIGYAGIHPQEIERLSQTGFLSKHERQYLMAPEFKISNSFYIPHDNQILNPIRHKTIRSQKQLAEFISWHPDDILFIPLKVDDTIIGTLSLDDPFDGRRPTPQSLSILELFANKVANIILRTNLYCKLQDTQQYLSNLIESSTDIILTTDLDYRIMLVNSAASQILKYQPDEIKGQDLASLLQSSDKIEHLKTTLNSSLTGKVVNYAEVLKSKDNQLIPVELSVILLCDTKKNPIGIEIIAKDITEHLKLEEIRLKSERFDTISKMAVTIAHEVNNPLQIIMDNTRFLFEDLSAQDSSGLQIDTELQRTRTIWKQIYRIKDISERLKKISNNVPVQDIAYTHDITMLNLKATSTSLSLNGISLLIVDDEVGIRDNMKFFLEKKGAHTDTAGDGNEALQKAQTGSYQLIISDIKMPEMDGYQLFKELRDRGIRTPILLMTAFGYDPDHIAVRSCVEGCPMPLFKPVDTDLLEHRILELIIPSL